MPKLYNDLFLSQNRGFSERRNLLLREEFSKYIKQNPNEKADKYHQHRAISLRLHFPSLSYFSDSEKNVKDWQKLRVRKAEMKPLLYLALPIKLVFFPSFICSSRLICHVS